MLIVTNDQHTLHQGTVELHRGELLPCFESPERVELILEHLRRIELGMIVAQDDFGIEPIRRIHDVAYLEFLQHAHAEWIAAGADGDAIPHAWVGRHMRRVIPESIFGKLGYYASDAGTPMTATTWQAAYGSAQATLTAQAHVVATGSTAFSLNRPPGHHAARDEFGGYCFLNNAAIAAQAFRDSGAERVAIIDVDFHHGNGTQDIFYARDDVLCISLHGDPANEYPYFLGYECERGTAAGEGFNLNCPLPPGTNWSTYRSTLGSALERLATFDPAFLVVALGVDTFRLDPISRFTLESDDFVTLGRDLASVGVPTLFVMEGGYSVSEIGLNVGNVLQGFAAK